MVDTSSQVVGNYDSEEFVDLYNQDEDHGAFNEAVQAEVDEIAGDDGIDDGEQEEIDTLLSDIDDMGAAWDEDWEALDALETGDMTDAEKAEREGLMDSAEEIMDVLKEAITVAEDRVDTINEFTIEIGDDGGTIEATDDTDHDLTVQLDGSSTPFTDTDDDGVIYNVSDDETNILEEGRIPIYINTPALSASPTSGNDLVFTYEGKDENGDAATRTITIKDYDPSKYVIYFQGDSITQDMVDNGTLASWSTDILGSSVWDDDEWSLLVRVNGPSAWDEFQDLTSDANINQAIGYVPEAAGLGEAMKSSWETLWQGHIDGDVDEAWAEVVGQYSGETLKALISAMSVSMTLDADVAEFFPTFFDSYGSTLQGLLDVDYENPTAPDLLGLMTIEEFTTAGASLGGDLYPETLFGSEGFEDLGEVKNPDVAIEAINDMMDISALSGHAYSSYLNDALEIQEGILGDGGYFSISDEQYDDMVSAAMTLNNIEETNSGVTESNLKNALIQALAQLKEMGMTTVEDARTNFLTVVNSVAASFGPTYLDDITAGLLYLLMKVDGGTSGNGNCSPIYESLVGNGEDADSLLFMSQIESLINNGSIDIDADGDGAIDSDYDMDGDGILDVDINGDDTIDSNDYSYDGLPNFYSDITEDFITRGGYTFETLPTTVAAPVWDTVWDGAIGGMLTGAAIGAGIGFLIGGPIGALIGGGIGLVVGFFTGGAWDAAVKSTTTWAAEAWDTITFWD